MRVLGDAGLDERHRSALRLEDLSDGAAVTLADRDDDALAVLIDRKATVATVLDMVNRLDVVAEVSPVDLRNLAFSADASPFISDATASLTLCERANAPLSGILGLDRCYIILRLCAVCIPLRQVAGVLGDDTLR